MNILILANHYAVASGRYAADALRRLRQHTVFTDGAAPGRELWGGFVVPPSLVWTPDPPPDDAVASLDLVIVMDSDPAVLHYAKRYKDAGKRVVVWGVDNHVRDYRRPWFDHYYLAHKEVSIMDWQADMTWLPCAYDETIFTPGLPWTERTIDVALIGVLYPHRRAAVNVLKAAGLNVVAGMGLIGTSCAAIYQDAKVSLCLSANHDVGQRVFESLACGCAVFTDPLPDLDWLLIPGLAVWDGDDLVGSVKSVLENAPAAMRAINDAQQATADATWTRRALTLLDKETAR